jgi:enoyl-CoA hydratase
LAHCGHTKGEQLMSDFLFEQADALLRVTINHPERGNAMTDDMAIELTGIIEGAAARARVMVLTGAGADFCIGRHRGTGGPPPPTDALGRREVSDVIFNCYGAFRRAPIPIIGIVRGRALGFGCAIAALCDITLAGAGAQFQVPEYAHNIMPTMVMSALVDRVPRKVMGYLVYSTALVGAERALACGLASEVVPDDKLDETAGDLCRNILKAPLPATLAVKEFLRSGPDMTTPAAVEYARNLHATINSAIEARMKRP